MKVFTVHQAKTQLSRLIASAIEGEEVVIARGREPVVRLVPLGRLRRSRVAGADVGKVWIAEDFSVLPDDALAAFEAPMTRPTARKAAVSRPKRRRA
ncbi:MAG: type II toxin-antitoxin system Phd/YefM family antitoxin [Deltaproteobacteria bacterium]|nr:type II toxin-antitoxin system Phd/YefM family antitoxin [Deltaproteobacteria bacterium]